MCSARVLTGAPAIAPSAAPGTAAFVKALGKTIEAGEPRATHRKPKRRYKTRVRIPSMLEPHVATIEARHAAEPQLTALAIFDRLTERHPVQFGPKQQSIVQRLLKALRIKAAQQVIAKAVPTASSISPSPPVSCPSDLDAGLAAHVQPRPQQPVLGNIPP